MSVMAIAIISVLIIFLIISAFYIVRFGTIIIQVQDAIEESLDLLDERYASMQRIIETPLFHDSPEIRKVLNDIRMTRDSIITIADSLTNVGDQIEIEDEPEEE
ncbi:MAG: hypothetical protein CMB80_08885 [Flammeovirgaceae bacterium]|nr:hypothetical protein [Flammeovirgaceae bacterium]|tara:strand:- start:2453 stop:2764 length:312 start_codon:yes stop_codon:yes gene_type:complete